MPSWTSYWQIAQRDITWSNIGASVDLLIEGLAVDMGGPPI